MKNKKTRAYNSIVRQKQAEETKNRIADAAEELIKASGYENTTIGEIAKRAGVATQTVYAVFGSKQGILVYLMKRSLQETRFELDLKKVAHYESISDIAKEVAQITTSHGQRQISTVNSLGGFELLYPELFNLMEEASTMRRQSIEGGIRESMERKGKKLKDSQIKIITDIMWAFTDNHLYYILVEEAGWPTEQFEKLFHKILIMVMRDIAPEMLEAFDE